MNKTTSETFANQQTHGELVKRLEVSIQKTDQTGRPFAMVLIQIGNAKNFKAHRPAHVVQGLYREMLGAVRKAVHPSQFVGVFQDGIGVVFDMVDVGQVDIISRKLVVLIQHVIRSGKYNDLSSRWTDIIYQFLWPTKPSIIFPCAGWAIYPRDGQNAAQMVQRAFLHIMEMQR